VPSSSWLARGRRRPTGAHYRRTANSGILPLLFPSERATCNEAERNHGGGNLTDCDVEAESAHVARQIGDVVLYTL
jgi:hypothetical protein